MADLVYALVPARSGSKGLLNKNILPIDGHPLLSYAIAFGRALGVDRVILSSDSPEYMDIGRLYGATCPFLRGSAASSDTAMEEDIVAELAEKLPGVGIPLPGIWVRLKPTNPFRKLADVRSSIKFLQENPDIDSVRHVTAAETRLQVINSEGFLQPLSPDWPAGRSVIRRTEFPKAYQVFNLDVFRHKNWERYGSAYMGTRVHPCVGEEITSMDINNPDDYALVKAMVESRPRPDVVSRHLVMPEMV